MNLINEQTLHWRVSCDVVAYLDIKTIVVDK